MRVVGMLSGTSVDGLDVAVADLDVDAAGTLTLRPLHCATVPWPADLRRRVLATLPPAPTTADEMCRLDTEIGQFAGATAAAAVATHGGDLVVSLGQTVFHWIGDDGRARGTLQLGQPAWIVEATGRPVVSDLRARDVAAGGQGAPLASTLDALWLRGPAPRAALNLGGIANITVVADAATAVVAYDTGPANCLLDIVAARASGGADRHDVDGALARAGRVDEALLRRMLAEPYFAAPAPKSTGRELFTGDWLDAAVAAVHGGAAVPAPDLAATLVELTARTVADACRAHGVTEVVGAGGGMHNPVLVERLAAHLGPVALRASDELGLPVDAKEAFLVTLLGWLTWHGVPGVVPGGTGSRAARVLGRISPGDAPLRLPEPRDAPTSLVVVA